MQIKKKNDESLFQVRSHMRVYDVVFEKDFSFLNEYIKEDKRIFLIDRNVYVIYRKILFKQLKKEDILLINAKEEEKNLTTAMCIYDRLLLFNVKRKLKIIAIGGGIIQDIGSFVASTLYRGVTLVCVPTTLLSQVDSCIGSKTSLNYKTFKNILGTFYPPYKVHIQQLFLRSLSEKDIYCGLGEIVKLQLMNMHNLGDIRTIEKGIQTVKEFIKARKTDMSWLIHASLQIKKQYIEIDEFDLGIRNLLNFGHEFGHALESASEYHIPHGIGVTIGILFANEVAQKRGLLSLNVGSKIENTLLLPSIPKSILKKQYFSSACLLEGMKKDKKRESNNLVIVVLKDNCHLEKLVNVSIEEFQYALQAIIKLLFLPRKKEIV
ncbi:MAG: hypothetical protein V1917_01275 [Candidatus Gottesmanbacteria bacterium]